MTQEAYDLFDRALSDQHARNEARRIRTRVNEARSNPHPASIRWPLELLQNALDSGPRNGSSITIRIHWEPNKLVFEHDGAAFTSDDLAALLTGGSSKEFESEVTTGRYGTGFLVTHVLAERTSLRGLLAVPKGYEIFELALDRSGDEDAILANSRSCNEAIKQATPIADLSGVPSARFEYQITDETAVHLGVNALKEALPYLYGTRKFLGKVEITASDDTTDVWTPGEVLLEDVEDSYIESRTIELERDGEPYPTMCVYRFMTQEESDAAALVLVEETDGGWEVLLPDDEAPRIYREYPLRGSGFVPTNFIFDGKFEPDQERLRLLMTTEDKALLADAFAAGVLATQFAFEQKWKDAHLLARASVPVTVFDPRNAEETKWWTSELANFARRLSTLPIIDCPGGSLAAISSGTPCANFVIPRLLLDSASDETTVERLWPLVAASTGLMPPRKELAVEWTEIAEGWHSLGLKVTRITVKALAEWVGDAERLEDLEVEGDETEWLARFFDIVGECWSKRTGVELSVLDGLMPDQNGQLGPPAALHRDAGVSSGLKDICKTIGHDVREKLLLREIDELAAKKSLQYVSAALKQAIPTSLSEGQVIDEAIKHLSEGLPEDEDCEADSADLQHGTVLLLDYLWKSQNKGAAPIAKKVPLITSNEVAVRWSHDRMMMAPVCSWHEAARPFANAYPPQRVLADFFAGDADLPDVVPALIEFGIAIADPITIDTPSELKGPRLTAISSENTEGVVVSNEHFSQIALLQPEVLNRCQEGVEEARALLGLVLCHVAPHDPQWQMRRSVKGRKARQDVQVPVRGALWLADLKTRSWVPVPGEDDKHDKMRADPKTLMHLLDPAWVENNDAAIRLLTEWFEFDELELRLLGLAPDPEKRRELRSGIAKLVETGGADPAFYSSLAADVEEKRRRIRDIERCRRLGLAVQEAVKQALETHGLKLALVDHGFDYEVANSAENVIEDVGTTVDVGPYLLEIKATTVGQARLTSTQAETASDEASRFVLCVVDLRSVPAAELDSEWTPDRVEGLAKITIDIGGSIQETCELVDIARNNDVSIKNEAALRYEVPPSIWEAGVSISEWVEMIRQSEK